MNRLMCIFRRYLWLGLFLLFPLLVQAQDTAQSGQMIISSQRDKVMKLYVINADGTALRPLDNRNNWEASPKISPDGRHVAFIGFDDKGNPNIALMDIDGSNPRQLTDSEHCLASYRHFAWSPDSTRLAVSSCMYENTGKLAIMTLDGNVEREVTINQAGIVFSVGGWTPDGTQILLDINALTRQNTYTNGTLFLLDLKTSTLHQLTRDVAVLDGRLSPDGTRIAYVVRNDANKTMLYTMNFDGSNTRVVDIDYNAVKGVQSPAWSPDGTRLAFTSIQIDGQFNIMVVNSDGTLLKQVTNEGRNLTADWVPYGVTLDVTASP